MKRGSTLFLRAVVVLLGVIALAFCLLWLPGMAARDVAKHPETAHLQYPFLIGAYIVASPFFFALYQAFKILGYIDRNKVFSLVTVNALRNIKYCAIATGVLVALSAISVALFVEGDRAGVVALGIYTTFASSVVATGVAVAQKLLQNAVDMKAENDLTV
jgi:hypothetical protein